MGGHFIPVPSNTPSGRGGGSLKLLSITSHRYWAYVSNSRRIGPVHNEVEQPEMNMVLGSGIWVSSF